MKGLRIFSKKGKLSRQYMGPYEVAKPIEKVAYKFKLPMVQPAPVLPVFHWSILQKCIGYLVSILPLNGLKVNANLYYKEVMIENLDR